MVSKQRRQTSIEAARIGSPANPGALTTAATPASFVPLTTLVNFIPVAMSGSTSMHDGPFSTILALLPLKLDRENFSFLHLLVLPSVRAFDLEYFLFGTRLCPPKFISLQAGEGSSSSQLQIGSLTLSMVAQRVNLDYFVYMRTDQALMIWLLSSSSESMLGHVIHYTSSSQIWVTLQQLFTTTSKARVLQL